MVIVETVVNNPAMCSSPLTVTVNAADAGGVNLGNVPAPGYAKVAVVPADEDVQKVLSQE
jgi:hypothetical protein